MRREARVERVENGQVWVSAELEHGCGRCEEPGGCKSGLMSKPLGERCNTYVLEASVALRVGQRVELELPDHAVVQAALMAYGLPLLAMLLCGGFASLLFVHDRWVALSALAGLGLAWWAVSRKLSGQKMRAMQVRLVNTLDS